MPEGDSPDRWLLPGYVAALALLGRVFRRYEAATGSPAILVGGAAAALYTAGRFPSADFDIVAAHDVAFHAAMLAEGGIPEGRHGRLLIGYYHPAHPAYGFQQVSGRLLDGRAEHGRALRVDIAPGSAVVLPAVEDCIADRLGQHAVASPTDPSRLRQAQWMAALAPCLDATYLWRRVTEEGGNPALLGTWRDAEPGMSRGATPLQALLRGAMLRRAELGLGDEAEAAAALRNQGGSRTPQKRQLLWRIEQRGLVGFPGQGSQGDIGVPPQKG